MPKDRVLVLMPPSPPYMNVLRDYAGGYGVAFRSSRNTYGHEEGSAPYVSALYAAAILARDGWEADILDCQAEQLTDSCALDRIEGFDPRVVLSAVSLPSIKGDLAFLGELKRRLPDVKAAALGTVCKALYGELLGSGCVTAAVRGDAEVVSPGLVNALAEGADLSEVPGIAFADAGGNPAATQDSEPLSDLNALPMPPYDKMPMDRYWEPSWGPSVRYMAVLDGRGCPHRCGDYCPYPFGFGRKPLLRDPELVADEVQYLHERFGTQAFLFRNQNFTLNRAHAEGICEQLLRRGLRVRWLCETRLDSVDEELLKLMKSAGCERIHYGLESGDPELFSSVGKPGSDLEAYGRLVQLTREAGIVAKLNVVVGLPGESRQSIRTTIRTIRRLKPDVVMAAVITPYPGTKVFEEARRMNLLLTEDWSRYTGFDPVMRTQNLTAEQLLRAQKAVSECLDSTPYYRKLLRKARRLFFARSRT